MVESHLKHFIEKGYPLRGVVHVGANDGAEVAWYVDQGLKPILCFEPHPAAVERARQAFTKVSQLMYVQAALGMEAGELVMYVPVNGDDEKTSGYIPVLTEGHDWTAIEVKEGLTCQVVRFDEWAQRNQIDCTKYNALVIDAQGMELEVLIGFGDRLNFFDFLCVEMSAKPIYEGEPPAEAVIDYLADKGFVRDTEVQEHDDVMFVREILRKGAQP